MSTTNTIAKVFETVLSVPGMNDNIKIQLSIPRKNVLLLSKVIERGLTGKGSLTYHRSIKELNEYWYIKYDPSSDTSCGRLFFLPDAQS